MDLSLILNRLSVLESRVAALENPEPQRDGDQESTPTADATKAREAAEAVNPFLQRHPRAAQKQPDALALKPKPQSQPPSMPSPQSVRPVTRSTETVDAQQQPGSVMQPEPPQIGNPTPTNQQPPSVTEQIQRMREGLNDRPDPALQPERDPHLVDVPGQDAPQYVFDADTPDRDMQIAKQNVVKQAWAATMDERQRRVQENAVERQTERRNRIQQGRDGLSADERTPEEKFNEALEVARKRSSLQGEARQRFDRQQQRQQQASGFDPWQAFEGTNQFVPPRAHEAIQTRPGRETDGLPHETFGKTVVDATKASTRAMERLSGELGEALARIEQIERDIEMRGHA